MSWMVRAVPEDLVHVPKSGKALCTCLQGEEGTGNVVIMSFQHS